MARFDLKNAATVGDEQRGGGAFALSESALRDNARWFIGIRWCIALGMAGFGLVSAAFPRLPVAVGLVPQGWRPVGMAAMLAVANALFLAHVRGMAPSRRAVHVNIWVQIASDLLLLTYIVFAAGPLDSFIAFAYLFHIVLACIFFAPRESFCVTALATLLFSGSVLLDQFDILHVREIFACASGAAQGSAAAFRALTAVVVWFAVWYLAATMSGAVRQRDRELDDANRRLRKADEEKNLQIIRITHDLKAPFSGIESNIHMLRFRLGDQIPEPALEIIRNMEVRSATLRDRIRDILLLGDLKQGRKNDVAREPVNLQALTNATVRDLAEQADRRQVAVHCRVPAMVVESDPKQLTSLLANLLANAIAYSHPGGEVVVEGEAGARAKILVRDNGLGIAPEALPHIFEEYYSAKEAVQVNRQSTGLGLSIVKQVAQNLGLDISVNSEQGKGSTFEATFPRKERRQYGQNPDN